MFPNQSWIGLPVVIVAGLVTLVTNPVSAAVIDYFAAPNFAMLDTAGGGAETQSFSSPAILGGQRDVELEVLSGSTSTAAIVSGSGTLNFGTDGGTLARVDLTYDQFSNVDLTAEGHTGFQLLLALVDGAADIGMTVNGVTANTTYSGSGSNDFRFLFIPFSAFAGVDFTQVDSITLSLTSTAPSSDLNLDHFATAVPEPGSLGLVGLGAVLLLRRRRHHA